MEVGKVPGDANPADLMTKYLSIREVEERLGRMQIGLEVRDEVKVQEVTRQSRLSWWRKKGSKVKPSQRRKAIGRGNLTG